MLKVFIVGGFDEDESSKYTEDSMREFGQALGVELARQGHMIVSGCRSDFDHTVAKAFKEELGDDFTEDRLVSYILIGEEPRYDFGRKISSRLTSWDPGENFQFIPEPIQMADVVILVGGDKSIGRAAFWAEKATRPILPVAYFGGKATEIYQHEFDKFEDKYSHRVNKLTYELLNEIGEDWNKKAIDIVALAQDIGSSQSVLVVMSYSEDEEIKGYLNNLFDSFEIVCKEFGYSCEIVNEQTGLGRIVPMIFNKIKQAGFIIVDLTDLKPNVFYEFGYAVGLDKQVVVTAKDETKLPFDINDVPTLFWKPNDQTAFRKKLREKVKSIADIQGRSNKNTTDEETKK
jgi:hypothetical protein